jgi:hypothetical protein
MDEWGTALVPLHDGEVLFESRLNAPIRPMRMEELT